MWYVRSAIYKVESVTVRATNMFNILLFTTWLQGGRWSNRWGEGGREGRRKEGVAISRRATKLESEIPLELSKAELINYY